MKILIKLALSALCILMLPITPRCLTSGHLVYDNPYYIRPTKPADTRIKVEIIVRDDLTDETVDAIQEVTFDGKNLALNPKDFMGNRGTFYFKTAAGRHEITWTIKRTTGWPSTQTLRKTIEIGPDTSLYWIEIYKDEIKVQEIQ